MKVSFSNKTSSRGSHFLLTGSVSGELKIYEAESSQAASQQQQQQQQRRRATGDSTSSQTVEAKSQQQTHRSQEYTSSFTAISQLPLNDPSSRPNDISHSPPQSGADLLRMKPILSFPESASVKVKLL
jgi:G3E family GTPase